MLEEKQGQFLNLHRISNKTSNPDFRFLFLFFYFFFWTKNIISPHFFLGGGGGSGTGSPLIFWISQIPEDTFSPKKNDNYDQNW